jgi:hypothetical protein
VFASGADHVLVFFEGQDGKALSLTEDAPCVGFLEGREYWAPVPKGWSGYSLLVDEVSLPISAQLGENVWRWRPGFFAGRVEAELRDRDGATLHRYILDVAPEPGKLGADVFAEMVNELRAFRGGMLLGTESSAVNIGVSGDVQSLNIAYARLRAYGSLFVKAVRTIADRPIRRPSHTRVRVPAHQSRYVDQQTLRAMVRTPAAAALATEDARGADLGLLDVPGTFESVDNAANRAIVFLLRSVRTRISRVREQLHEAMHEAVSETRTSLAGRVPERLRVLEFLDHAVGRLASSSPFDLVTRAELTTAGLNAISASPAYARAYRLAWWILRAGIDAELAAEKQWMAPTWEIFERWCFLQVLRQVAKALDANASDWQIAFKNDCVAVGKHQLGSLNIELTMQDTFRAWDVAKHSRLSISAERRPDLTLVLTDASKGRSTWVVLDSKYTTKRDGILAAMASAHIYRDSLRLNGQPPCLSLLLTPAVCDAAWLMTDEFIARERVGVVNASDSEALIALVRKIESGYPVVSNNSNGPFQSRSGRGR